ncbi:MAG: nicotinate (nicotinamide) nucleotide adenylyltransferase [Oscillospiraceae bacterium]|nr:nicotinate (nicotinamide) nucleotide adenylyltransferase [Oscillospiraceae bacterium]
MKIGIFGGTFNPPHKGHARMIEKLAAELELDKVLIIPNKVPTHKRCDDLADNQDRLNMCRMAFRDPKFEVSTVEMDRESDSYTIYTVDELIKKYPNDKLYLIIGSDMFLIFHKWYKHREILEKCTVCVASRNTEDSVKVLRAYAFERLGIYINGLDGKNIHISPMDAYIISSGEIRDMISKGKSVYGYVEPEIIEYMESRGLYGYAKKR